MNPLSVISDASASIALEEIGLLVRPAPLFERCVIPPVVAVEIAPTVDRPSWIEVRALSGPVPQPIRQAASGWARRRQ